VTSRSPLALPLLVGPVIGLVFVVGLARARPAAAGSSGSPTPLGPLERLDAAEARAALAASDGLVFLDVHADWCPTCLRQGPIVEALAAEFAGRVRFVRVDADREGRVLRSFGASRLPTYIVFENGEEIDRLTLNIVPFFLEERLRGMLTRPAP
jgi:thiol-disulfide isomerase/thioredoxin